MQVGLAGASTWQKPPLPPGRSSRLYNGSRRTAGSRLQNGKAQAAARRARGAAARATGGRGITGSTRGSGSRAARGAGTGRTGGTGPTRQRGANVAATRAARRANASLDRIGSHVTRQRQAGGRMPGAAASGARSARHGPGQQIVPSYMAATGARRQRKQPLGVNDQATARGHGVAAVRAQRRQPSTLGVGTSRIGAIIRKYG